MAEQIFGLNARHIKQIRQLVRDSHSQPRTRPRYRRRQPAFQPTAAGTVYQCVTGICLRARTAADPDNVGVREPVCLAVPIGDVSQSAARGFTHAQVKRLRDLLRSAGALDTKGMVSQKAIDELVGDRRIGDIIGEQLGEAGSVRTLRCRHAGGYIGTGATLIGNDDEVWQTLGREALSATIDSTIDGQFYLAKIVVNEAALDAGVAKAADRLEDWIVVKDEITLGAFTLDEREVGVEFQQQVWFDNDSAYSPDYWYQHSLHGWLPVFTLTTPILRFRGETAEAINEDALGDVTVMRRSGATSYASTGDTIEALNDLDIDIESGATVEVVFDPDGSATPRWRIVNADYTCP